MDELVAEGFTGTITFDGEWITIDHSRQAKPSGVMRMPGMKTGMKIASMASGAATGSTRIHVSDVTGVDFRPAKSWIAQGQGHLGFLIPGITQRVTHSGGGTRFGFPGTQSQLRTHDENYVTFFPDHQAAFERIRGAVENARIASRRPVQAPVETAPTSLSVADELKKLAQLRDEGIVSGEEFDAQKARLLGS